MQSTPEASLFRNKSVNGKIIKILALNIGIAVVDIIFLSPGLLGIEIIGGSTFGTAFGALYP